MCGKKDTFYGDFALTKGMFFEEFPLTKGILYQHFSLTQGMFFSQICSKAAFARNIFKEKLRRNVSRMQVAQNISLSKKVWFFHNFSLTKGRFSPNFSLTKGPILNMDAAHTVSSSGPECHPAGSIAVCIHKTGLSNLHFRIKL